MGSRYALVVVAAKRARQLLEGVPQLELVGSDKPVTVALHEIAGERLSIEAARAGTR